MPVRVRCPHCQTTCQVAEQHVGMPVQCGRCSRTFTTRPSAQGLGPAPVPRLDIGGAAPQGLGRDPGEYHFFVHHLIWTHLDERNELGVLMIAGSPMLRSLCAAFAPLLSGAVGGASKEAADVPKVVAGAPGEADRAAVLVAWDGQVHIGRANGCRLYHYHGGQLSAIPAEKPSPLPIVPGDWIAATSAGSLAEMDTKTIQEGMAKAHSAAPLAQAWAERSGAVVVVLRAV